MRVIPEVAGIAIGGIFVSLAVVVGALVTIILLRVDAEGLTERPIDIQVDGRDDAASRRCVGNAGPEVDRGDVLPGVIGPLHVLACGGELDEGMAGSLQLRAGVFGRWRGGQ